MTDGLSEGGEDYLGPPRVELVGSAGVATGLDVLAGASTIKGLVISGSAPGCG